MRDLIWTIIILWLVWKVIDAIKGSTPAKKNTSGFFYQNQQHGTYSQTKEGDVRVDKKAPKQKTYFKPEDGEYVDYEEVK